MSKQEIKQNTGTTEQEQGIKQDTGILNNETTGKIENSADNIVADIETETKKPEIFYPVEKYTHDKLTLTLKKGIEIPKNKIKKYLGKKTLTLKLSRGKNPGPKILYKNSNRIKIYSGFENPVNMRSSIDMDENLLVKQENKKPTIISLKDDETIYSTRKNTGESASNDQNSGNDLDDGIQNKNSVLEEEIIYTGLSNQNEDTVEINNEKTGDINESKETMKDKIMYEIDKYERPNHKISMKKGDMPEINLVKIDKYEHAKHSLFIKKSAEIQHLTTTTAIQEDYIIINKPELSRHQMNIANGRLPEITLIKIDKYNPNVHYVDLKKGKMLENNLNTENNELNLEVENSEHNFVVENIETIENGLSDPLLEDLLENDEIDINTLESENDEFLQKVFEHTKDRDVMNLIVENYLNEYQFVKAKKFIENLPEIYSTELKPSLNLRVAFNSFSLSSKTRSENLTSMVQDYISKNEISEEDKNRYLGIIELMARNYDRFFEISSGFTSEKNISFALKLQGYKDQISKQMGMPEYYFDTLVSLELFNQGLFQPAKILALYSLQKNPGYILPHQVLAYANFLTNSWDTSIEYFKKLVDLDPNNAEKYHFLMGVASYRDEKYEQSVVMLSMIKDESLRLDTQRYLINNYIKLDQKNKLISTRNKLLGSENLVASDFYTYFYETFFHPYSEGLEFQLYAYDTELANKMLRICSTTLQNEEKAVCTYGTIGRNIAMGQFEGLEQYLLNLATEYPQGYLYQALGDYYIQQGNPDKAKIYLIKAISLTQKKSERSQIKKLLQNAM